ncbi:MAG: NAD-binding protein [Thermodesulfobacteriota bacterium]|nr:NAD-binding protein [Thermodesulfobacteriota bacterium]
MKVIIVGAGEVGFHIARRLASESKEVVVIDRNPEALKRFSALLDVPRIEGSGAHPKIPEEAEIRGPEFRRK